MKQRDWINYLLMAFLTASLFGCGGSGGSGGAAGGGTVRIGGAVQGAQLALINKVETFAGTPNSADGQGTAARFSTPRSITADAANLYVADSFNHTIRKIVIATGVVSTLA